MFILRHISKFIINYIINVLSISNIKFLSFIYQFTNQIIIIEMIAIVIPSLLALFTYLVYSLPLQDTTCKNTLVMNRFDD